MKTTIVFAFLIAVSAVAAQPPAPDARTQRVYSAAQERVAAGEFPAIVVATVIDGKTDIRAFGKLDDGKPADAKSVFEIGSITKTFTGSLLADEVHSGTVGLEAPVGKLLPGFSIPERSGKPITLLDLATQTSGLPRLPTNMGASAENPYADYGAAKLKTFLAGYKLTRDPGSQYEYSNLGFGLLGYALAQQEHSDYATLLKRRILDPLKMTDSGVSFSPDMRAHLAVGHNALGKATGNWDFDALAGCGAIRSTAQDMVRYLRANMGLDNSPLDAVLGGAQQPRRDVPNGRIGLAWMTRKSADGDIVWHNGMTGGYASFIGFDAKKTRGVVVLTNTMQAVDDLGFAALINDAPLAPVHKTVSLDPAVLKDYVGDYQLGEHFFLNMSLHDGQLLGQATGQGAFPLFASAKDEFFAKIVDLSVSFQRGANGSVSGLVLHQNGDHPATRVDASKAGASPARVTLEDAVLRGYPGHYELAPGADLELMLKDGQLYAQLTGQGAYPIYATAKDHFFYTVVDAQIEFHRDAAGKVVSLTLHQNGRDLDAKRTDP